MPTRKGLTPWIEKLIESYTWDGSVCSGVLQAHVVRVSQMSQSQALVSEGLAELLLLSDEHVSVPAVLTASAWEDLQENEDLECVDSLLHHSVCITDYRLLFHRSSELNKSRFFLSVGKLGTRAVVETNSITPCCTVLPSVKTKISETWCALVGQQDSRTSQSGFNLTELLEEWQQDLLRAEVEKVHKLLTEIPEPSTSTKKSTATLPDTCTGTSWDMDMVRYKGSDSFAVPVQYLLIPDMSIQPSTHLQTGTESERPSEKSETSSEPQMSSAKQQSGTEDTVDDLDEGLGRGIGMCPLSNPWNMCPPPTNTSSTRSSPQTSAVPHSPSESVINLIPVDTSCQLSAQSTVSQGELLTEPSLFPPYQRPPPAAASLSSTSTRPPANVLSSTGLFSSTTTQESERKKHGQICRRSLRKREAPPHEEVVTEMLEKDEGQMGCSPPSWMFDSVTGSTPELSISQTRVPPVGTLTEARPCVHSDGKPFSYTYQVNGQDLQHLSRLTLSQDLLQWAVRHLLRHRESGSTGATAPEAHDCDTSHS